MFGFLSVKYLKEFSSLENINMQKVFLSLLAIFHVLSIYIMTCNARFVFQTKKKQLTIKVISKQVRLNATKSVLVYYQRCLHELSCFISHSLQ